MVTNGFVPSWVWDVLDEIRLALGNVEWARDIQVPLDIEDIEALGFQCERAASMLKTIAATLSGKAERGINEVA